MEKLPGFVVVQLVSQAFGRVRLFEWRVKPQQQRRPVVKAVDMLLLCEALNAAVHQLERRQHRCDKDREDRRENSTLSRLKDLFPLALKIPNDLPASLLQEVPDVVDLLRLQHTQHTKNKHSHTHSKESPAKDPSIQQDNTKTQSGGVGQRGDGGEFEQDDDSPGLQRNDHNRGTCDRLHISTTVVLPWAGNHARNRPHSRGGWEVGGAIAWTLELGNKHQSLSLCRSSE